MPITLKEFKARYPQYKDWPDEHLAREAHQKFYSTGPNAMSFEDFAKGIGYTLPTQKPGLLGQVREGIHAAGRLGHKLDVATGMAPGHQPEAHYQLAPKVPGAPYDITYPGPPKVGLGQFITSIPSGTGGFLKSLGQHLYGPTVPTPEEHYIPTKTMPRVPEAPYDISEPTKGPPSAWEITKHIAGRPPRAVLNTLHDLGRVFGLGAWALERFVDPESQQFAPWVMEGITEPSLRERAQPLKSYEDTEFGKFLRKSRDELIKKLPEDERLKGSYLFTVLPDAASSMGTFMLASYLSGGANIGVDILAMTLEGSEGYDRMMEATGDPWQALKAGALTAPAGMLERFGVEQVMRPLLKLMPPGQRLAFGKMLLRGIKTGLVEAGEEKAQALWGNVVLRLMGQNQDLAEGLWIAASSGFIVGTVAQVLTSMLGFKLQGGKLLGPGGQMLWSEDGPGDYFTTGQSAIDMMTSDEAREILRKAGETVEIKPGPGPVETEVKAETVLPKPLYEALEQRAKATPELEKGLRAAQEMEGERVGLGVQRLQKAIERIQEPVKEVAPQRKVEEKAPAKLGEGLRFFKDTESAANYAEERGLHFSVNPKGEAVVGTQDQLDDYMFSEKGIAWHTAYPSEKPPAKLGKAKISADQGTAQVKVVQTGSDTYNVFTTKEYGAGVRAPYSTWNRATKKDQTRKQVDTWLSQLREEFENVDIVEEGPPAKIGKVRPEGIQTGKYYKFNIPRLSIDQSMRGLVGLNQEYEWARELASWTGLKATDQNKRWLEKVLNRDIIQVIEEEPPAKIGEKRTFEEEMEALAAEALKTVEPSAEKRGIREGERRFAGHETPVSPEAIKRMEQGKFVYWDVRTNKIREDTSKEAVDLDPGEAEIKAWVPNRGTPTIYAFGKHFDKQGLEYRKTRRQMFLNILEKQRVEEAPAKIAPKEAPVEPSPIISLAPRAGLKMRKALKQAQTHFGESFDVYPAEGRYKGEKEAALQLVYTKGKLERGSKEMDAIRDKAVEWAARHGQEAVYIHLPIKDLPWHMEKILGKSREFVFDHNLSQEDLDIASKILDKHGISGSTYLSTGQRLQVHHVLDFMPHKFQWDRAIRRATEELQKKWPGLKFNEAYYDTQIVHGPPMAMTRRGFLKTSGLAAAGLALSPTIAKNLAIEPGAKIWTGSLADTIDFDSKLAKLIANKFIDAGTSGRLGWELTLNLTNRHGLSILNSGTVGRAFWDFVGSMEVTQVGPKKGMFYELLGMVRSPYLPPLTIEEEEKLPQEKVTEKGRVRYAYPGEEITKPHDSYGEADKNTSKDRNLWVRLSDLPTNAGRTLLVQFSSSVMPQMEGLMGQYYDRLYSGTREGYVRPTDFWEIPEWIGVAANSLPNSDVYVVRNVKEAVSFLKEAGYSTVAFSALDVNKSLIQEIAKGYEGDIAVGGYGTLKEFSEIKNVTTYKDMSEFVSAQGQTLKKGVDYRHFKGTEVIPRLVLSEGCLHKCAFCDVVPHGKVIERSADDINAQIKAIKSLRAKLVYINDKTFGQAKNYNNLNTYHKRLKAAIPGFDGFIVQTTANAMKKLDPHWMQKAGVRYVEIGVESYNDPILRKWKKPGLTKSIDAAVQKIREGGMRFIPNILIGAKEETAETYANTARFLVQNADIISHINAYNLAVYEGTDLADEVGKDIAASDIDENALEKSWHKDEATRKLHRDFATWLYDWSIRQLGEPPGGRPGIKETKLGEGTLFKRLEVFSPEKVQYVSVDQAVTQGTLSKDEGAFIQGILASFPQSWQEHFEVGISGQEFAPTEVHLRSHGMAPGAEGLRVEGVLMTERIGDAKTDAKHLAVLFKGSNTVTFLHEFAEFIHRRALNMGERQLVGRLHRESGSKLERREWFCMEFEKWFVQDKPVKDRKLLRIFHKILESLQNVYRRLTAKRVNPQLAKMLKNLVTSGRDIRTDYYYSNQEALERYVLGQPASGTILESGGFANNSKTGISWDPASQCNKQLAFVDFIRENAPKYGLTADELVHPEVLADLYDLAKANGVDVPCDRCYVIGRRYAALRVQARGGTKTEVEFQRAKQAYFTVQYEGQIRKWSKKKIEDVNKRGGLRLFSFSGYNRQFHHAIVDSLLRDAEAVGLAVKAITENPEFIEDFGDRGFLINASIDSKSTGVDGMSWDDAAKWKKKYPDTVKVRAVFGSVEDLIRLASIEHGGFKPFIDILTPYHHEDRESALPAGAQDLSMTPVPTVEAQGVIDFINKRRPDLKEKTCCLVGAKCFSEKHNEQCACNCGLLAGNMAVPRNEIYAKVGRIDESSTLVGWVRSMGGVWDPSLRGETREFTSKESGVVGLVRKDGRPWDDLVDDAIASGWLEEGATSDDLREALRRDIQMLKEGGDRMHPGDEDLEEAFNKEMEESFLPQAVIPEDWREAGILVKEQFPAPKKFRGVSAKERGRRISAGHARRRALREAGGAHGQAANEDMADRTRDLTLSFLGMGDAPGMFSDMVKDVLHYAGVKSREPGRRPLVQKDINWKNLLRYIQMPDDIRRTFKQFDPVYQVQMARETAKEVLDNTMAKITEPYFSLKEKDRRAVDQMLLEGERAGIDMMAEADFQRYNATPDQIKGYTAIRKGLNTARELLIAQMEEYGVAEDIIEDFSNRSKGYVPHKWYGDWAVVVKQKTKKGKVTEPKAPWGGAFAEPTTRTVFMSAVGYTERMREVERLQKIFPESEGYIVTGPIKRTKIDYAAFQEAPSYAVTSMVDKAMERAGFDEQAKADMAGALRELYKSKGFGMHFIKRKGVAGYEENLARPLAEYFVGFSGYLTKMEAIQAFPKAMVGISMDKTPNLYKYALDYIGFVTGEEYDWHHVKTAAYMFYLFGNIKSAALNLTQNLVLGWPVLSTKTHFALPKMLQAMTRTASGLLTKGEREFVAALEEAGHLDPQLSQEIGGYVGNPVFRPFTGLGRKAFALLDAFGHAERFNRRAMAVALYDSGIQDFNEAASLITDAHFQYSKGNRPYISMQFRGALSPVMVFRSWYINYISWLKNQVKAGNVSPLVKSLSALTFFGGLGALPLWDLFKGLWIKAFGEDPETAARRFFGQRFGRDLIHGMPAEIGVEFSGSIGMADIIPKNLEEIVGVFGDIPGRVRRVWKAYLSGDYLRMLEDAAPEALRNPFAAYRLYKDGATSRSGRPVLDLTTGKQLKATKKEAALKSFGFYPIRLAEQYNIGETLETIKKDRMELKQGWADRYRIASLNRDTNKMNQIIGEITAYNKEMRDADRFEDQITTDELRAMIRIRSRAINRPPRYMLPKLKKLREQYKEVD